MPFPFKIIGIAGGTVIAIGAIATAGFYYAPQLDKEGIVSNFFKSALAWSRLGEVVTYFEKESDPFDKDMPKEFKLYSSHNEHKTHKDTFGWRFGNLLVNTENSESWWTWSQKRKHKFKKLNEGFKDISDVSKLKNACLAFYKQKIKEIKDTDQVWYFCSPLNEEPYSVNSLSKNKYRNKAADLESDFSNYLIADRPGNKNAWEIIYENLFKADKSSLSSDTFFGKVDKGYKKTLDDKENPSLNKTCDSLYELKTEELQDKKDKFFKYCSFSGVELVVN